MTAVLAADIHTYTFSKTNFFGVQGIPRIIFTTKLKILVVYFYYTLYVGYYSLCEKVRLQFNHFWFGILISRRSKPASAYRSTAAAKLIHCNWYESADSGCSRWARLDLLLAVTVAWRTPLLMQVQPLQLGCSFQTQGNVSACNDSFSRVFTWRNRCKNKN